MNQVQAPRGVEQKSLENPSVDSLPAEWVAHPSWVCVSSCESVEDGAVLGAMCRGVSARRPLQSLQQEARTQQVQAGGRRGPQQPFPPSPWVTRLLIVLVLTTRVRRKMQVGGQVP